MLMPMYCVDRRLSWEPLVVLHPDGLSPPLLLHQLRDPRTNYMTEKRGKIRGVSFDMFAISGKDLLICLD